MTVHYLEEAALLEDVANELIQVHQTLVVSDVMGEHRKHHGVLRRTKRTTSKWEGGRRYGGWKLEKKKGIGGEGEADTDRVLYERRVTGACLERKRDEEIVRKKGRRSSGGGGGESISQSLFIKWCSATER